MNPTELLNRLEAEGVGVTLNLKLEADQKPSDDTRALIRENRDALLEHLAVEFYGYSNDPRVDHLHLPPVLLHNLMLWVAKYHELRLEHPNGLTLNAQPHHIRDAVELHPWGVVYDPERYLLLSWGNVPEFALRGKRDLETGELLIAEAVAA